MSILILGTAPGLLFGLVIIVTLIIPALNENGMKAPEIAIKQRQQPVNSTT